MMGEDSLTELKLAFARMEATVTTKLENLIHDARNTRQSLEAFVPRREIDEMRDGMEKSYVELKGRVLAVEANQSKAAWSIVVAWIAGIGVAIRSFR